MTRDQYLLLFEKYQKGTATPDEIAALMAFKDDFELVETDEADITDTDRLSGQRILGQIDQSTGKGRVRRLNSSIKWYAAAATILIVLSAGLLLWKNYSNKEQGQQQNALALHDVAPGVDKAILTLSNGKKIVVTDKLNGTLATEGNVAIKKEKNGILQYVVSAGNPGEEKQETGYNTFSTPRGAEYHVVLPDGSIVWLNAASSIRFPTVFAANERRIELTGEAYFEIAKDKHKPFKVTFNNQEVEVLGTHFDIMAYADEPETRTTLLEGSVKISRGDANRILIPGQQAVGSATSKGLIVQQANLQEVMAWKNGFFLFRNTGIVNIMRQASRWYDVEVLYEGSMIEKQYGGRVSKYQNISELLKNLELTGTIHFKIEGRRVTVMR